jgi:Na+-translocating ferredoxin:NAD+ oxidoreductase RnfC subunit
MATLSGRHQMITFKAEEALVEAMEHIPNRSEFIRSAILAALEGVCPVCHGTGVLNPNQQRHWHEFSRTHRVERCDECDEGRLVCTAAGE